MRPSTTRRSRSRTRSSSAIAGTRLLTLGVRAPAARWRARAPAAWSAPCADRAARRAARAGRRRPTASRRRAPAPGRPRPRAAPSPVRTPPSAWTAIALGSCSLSGSRRRVSGRRARRLLVGQRLGVVARGPGDARDDQPGLDDLGGVARQVAAGLAIDELVAGDPDDAAVVRVPVALLEGDVDDRGVHAHQPRPRRRWYDRRCDEPGRRRLQPPAAARPRRDGRQLCAAPRHRRPRAHRPRLRGALHPHLPRHVRRDAAPLPAAPARRARDVPARADRPQRHRDLPRRRLHQPRTFSRTFRAIVGESPTGYRARGVAHDVPNCFAMAWTRPSSFGEANGHRSN